MTMDKACRILGTNRAQWELRNMHKALGLMTWLNTAEDDERRAAAGYVLRRWHAYTQECNKRRNLKGFRNV